MAAGSGVGTVAVGPLAVTAQNVIDTARTSLADGAAAEWPDVELLDYLNEAIQEYSQHLPRLDEVVLTATAGVTRYGLPQGTLAVLSVHYQVGGITVLLHQLGYMHAGFGNGYLYDLLPRFDLTAPPVLLLGFEPEAGATLTLRLQRPHDYQLGTASYVTVPAVHHHVLVHYLLYAAARRLQQQEQASPTSSSSLLMSQLASNARRLELAYLQALNRILYQRQGQGARVVWEMGR